MTRAWTKYIVFICCVVFSPKNIREYFLMDPTFDDIYYIPIQLHFTSVTYPHPWHLPQLYTKAPLHNFKAGSQIRLDLMYSPNSVCYCGAAVLCHQCVWPAQAGQEGLQLPMSRKWAINSSSTCRAHTHPSPWLAQARLATCICR